MTTEFKDGPCLPDSIAGFFFGIEIRRRSRLETIRIAGRNVVLIQHLGVIHQGFRRLRYGFGEVANQCRLGVPPGIHAELEKDSLQCFLGCLMGGKATPLVVPVFQ